MDVITTTASPSENTKFNGSKMREMDCTISRGVFSLLKKSEYIGHQFYGMRLVDYI